MSHLQSLGFVINKEKSQGDPQSENLFSVFGTGLCRKLHTVISAENNNVHSVFRSFSMQLSVNEPALPVPLNYYGLHDTSTLAQSADDEVVLVLGSNQTEPPPTSKLDADLTLLHLCAPLLEDHSIFQ